MLRRIGSVDNVPSFIEGVKDGEERLMGFGHRVYKNYDPRAKIIKKAADDVFEVTGINPLLKIAVELEKIALEDEYFVSRKLYPNVDFYSGLIYEALQFPPEMFTVLFAIPRTRAGWRSGWRCSATATRRSPGRSRSTPAREASSTSRWATADPEDLEPAAANTDPAFAAAVLLSPRTDRDTLGRLLVRARSSGCLGRRGHRAADGERGRSILVFGLITGCGDASRGAQSGGGAT